jgi:hypothetical protein
MDLRITVALICQTGAKPDKSTRPLASENDMKAGKRHLRFDGRLPVL